MPDVIAAGTVLQSSPPVGDNTRNVATTAWVNAAIAAAGSGSVAIAIAAAVAALRAQLKSAVVAGGSPGNITVTGLPATANLVAVVQFPGAGTTVTDVVSLTGQFTVTTANTINNTGGTDTTGGKLLVVWN